MTKLDLAEPPEDILSRNNSEILEVFLETLYAAGADEKTIKSYKAAITDFLEFIGNKPLKNITSLDVIRWKSYRLKYGFRKSKSNDKLARLTTLHYYSIFLRVFFRWLKLNVKVPIVKLPKRRIEILDENEIVRLILASKDTLDLLILTLLLETGLRISEALSLRVKDINFSKREIRVRNAKYNEERVVFFSELTELILKKWIFEKNLKPDDKLIPISYVAVWKRLKTLAKRANIDPSKVRPHILRHTFATNALRKGMNLLALKRLLGHKDLKVTEIYTHLVYEDLRMEYLKTFVKCGILKLEPSNESNEMNVSTL